MNKYIKQLTESLFDDIDDIFSDDDEDMGILSSLEDIYLPYIDLGLTSGTLWYKCNLGAKKETDPGLYFQWGDVQGYKDASNKNFMLTTYCYGTRISLTKYCNNEKYGKVDNKLELELSDDAAYKMTDDLACMPTLTLFKELHDECTWTWTSMNGIHGYRAYSKNNGNYIFLPTTGFCIRSSVRHTESIGRYWSSTAYLFKCNCAHMLSFTSSCVSPYDFEYRDSRFSVRPVLKQN